MSSTSTVIESSHLPWVATAATSEFTTDPVPDRRQEFEKLLPLIMPRFRRIATHWLGNPEDAEDAVQEAMLSAFTHIASFNGRAQMSSWLTAILINALRMQLRRRRRGRRMLSLDYTPREDQQPISELLPDPCPTPEKILERSELYALAVRLTDALSPSQKAAMRLRQQNDFSIRKAAKKLGIPEGTVKGQLARARAKLTERFHKVMARSKIQMSVSEV